MWSNCQKLISDLVSDEQVFNCFFEKLKRNSSMQSMDETDVEVPKKKKRRGTKRIVTYVAKKSYENPL